MLFLIISVIFLNMISSQEIEDDIYKIGLFIGENERKLTLLYKQKEDIEPFIEKLQGQELVFFLFFIRSKKIGTRKFGDDTNCPKLIVSTSEKKNPEIFFLSLDECAPNLLEKDDFYCLDFSSL